MILYSSPLSPFSARVRASLYHKALAFEAVKPSSLGGMAAPEFLAVAPLGRIPVLEMDGGERIAESDTIVEYLEDAFRQHSLRPSSPSQAAKARQLARIAELYVINRVLWGGPGTRRSLASMMPVAGGRAPLQRDASEVEREGAALLHALDNIARLLDSAGPFAIGNAPNIADGAMVPYLSFARYAAEYLEIDALRVHPVLYDYLDRTAADPVLARTRADLLDAMDARRDKLIEKFGALNSPA